MTATTLPCPFTVTCGGCHIYPQPNCGLPITENVSLADSVFCLPVTAVEEYSFIAQHLNIFSPPRGKLKWTTGAKPWQIWSRLGIIRITSISSIRICPVSDKLKIKFIINQKISSFRAGSVISPSSILPTPSGMYINFVVLVGEWSNNLTWSWTKYE